MRFPARLVCAALLALSCQATTLFTTSGALTLGDSTFSNRLFRNGVPSDWSSTKPFPGLSVSGTFYYRTFTIPVLATQTYLQISIDDPAAAIVATAYWGSFTPPLSATNYLGDAGSSGNFFGNPQTFQVVAPGAGNLVLVLSNALSGGADVGNPFGVLVEGFSSSSYDSVPEPATYGLVGLGFLALVVARRRSAHSKQEVRA